MSNLGPLLNEAMGRMAGASDKAQMLVVADVGGDETERRLPVVVQIPHVKPNDGERWPGYRARLHKRMQALHSLLEKEMGAQPTMLYTANALQADLLPDQVGYLLAHPDVCYLELDPVVQVTQMDDAIVDVELAALHAIDPHLTGTNVMVALLDSGADEKHPHLKLAQSLTVCGESTAIPGAHGTHCAGSIASRDEVYRGIAPDCTLINIKVLKSNGTGQHTDIIKGLDQAVEAGAQVISMSIGFNHLPTWSMGGHGWSCPSGNCPLCTAVDNAVKLENVVVVVAAGNDHEHADALRQPGVAPLFDTEISCPGHAREALTVAALTKNTFIPAPFSSCGPTAYGTNKPDLAAPGVNVTSLAPVPRDPNGTPIANPTRNDLFARKSGTSMATPIVAGAAALAIQKRMLAGQPWTPAIIRNDILTMGVVGVPAVPPHLPTTVVGAGRLTVRGLLPR